MFDISIQEISDLFRKLLQAIKDLFKWLGILILPEEGEYDYPDSSTVDLSEIVEGA